VLVIGGFNDDGFLFSAELYDPQTGNWIQMSNMTYSRDDHTASILLNRTVLVAGGEGNNGVLSSAEMFYL
jgi:N-acetylneuraminic acid mutarotase